MTQANDSFARNPDIAGSVALATHLVGGKEYPVSMTADSEGHIHGSPPAYLFTQVPRATTATAVDYFDIFNAAGSGKTIRLRGLWPIIDIPAAVAFTRAYVFDAYRTNAVGTGGAVAASSAAKPAAGGGVLNALDTTNPALPAGITIRTLPTGGAIASAYLWDMPILAEETQPVTSLAQGINMIPELAHDQPLVLREGQGFKVRQNTAVIGPSVGWLLAFTVP
jgi:hypothetical protein